MWLSVYRSRASKNLLRALRRIAKDVDACSTSEKAAVAHKEAQNRLRAPHFLVSYITLGAFLTKTLLSSLLSSHCELTTLEAALLTLRCWTSAADSPLCQQS